MGLVGRFLSSDYFVFVYKDVHWGVLLRSVVMHSVADV